VKFGLNFFRPSDPRTVPPRYAYYAQCLRLAARADELGYSSLKTVEHSFYDYGGHSPNPLSALGEIEPSMQINFGGSSDAEAHRTLELFAAKVMRHFN
jgi:hypothetical protein